MPLLIEPVSSYRLAEHDQPVLALDELVLRPWLPDDVPAVLRAYADPDIQRWHRLRIDDEPKAQEWVLSNAMRWTTGFGGTWAVTSGADVLGQVGLRNVNLFEGQAELSYWTLPAARGRGVARRAGVALTDWAFNVAGVHRMVLNHSTTNSPSCRVSERMGYRLEGTKRSQLRHDDGWHDMHLHARLRTDPPPEA